MRVPRKAAATLGWVSLALAASIAPSPAADRPTDMISTGAVDIPANAPSAVEEGPALSQDGRYVVYDSMASDIVLADLNTATDVFRHDRWTGLTQRASVDSLGLEANGPSHSPDISDDGRFVVFTSSATNLVLGDTNGKPDVFMHDFITGQTTRVSVNDDESQMQGGSGEAAVSQTGKYVAFSSLVDIGGTEVKQVLLRDLAGGNTEKISVLADDSWANGASGKPSITEVGPKVAFESVASDLIAGDTNAASDIFVYQHSNGAISRVSEGEASEQGNGASHAPDISADGTVVGFMSLASNLVDADDGFTTFDVFVKDVTSGEIDLISWLRSGGASADGQSTYPTVSGDGQTVVFVSDSGSLIQDDDNVCPGYATAGTCPDIFIRHPDGSVERASVSTAGAEANGASHRPAISTDGQVVVFSSDASNLVGDDVRQPHKDLNGVRDVFARSLGYPCSLEEDGPVSAFIDGTEPFLGPAEGPVATLNCHAIAANEL